MMKVIVLSGEIASGKTTFGRKLCNELGFVRVSTGEALLAKAGTVRPTRKNLQFAGNQLDEETDQRWVLSLVLEASAKENTSRLLVDSVRKRPQIAHIRTYCTSVCHVHVTAPEEIRRARFIERSQQKTGDENAEFDSVTRESTELQVKELADIADVVIDTSTSNQGENIERIKEKVG